MQLIMNLVYACALDIVVAFSSQMLFNMGGVHRCKYQAKKRYSFKE